MWSAALADDKSWRQDHTIFFRLPAIYQGLQHPHSFLPHLYGWR
jgi:hypothetical protein